MATVYSLFFGLLLTALCSGNGDDSGVLRPDVVTPSYVMSTVVETSKHFIGTNFNNSLFSLKPRVAHTFLLDQESTQRNQGLVARLNCLLISGNKTNSPDKSGSDKSDCFSEIIENSLRLAQPRPIYSDSASSSLQSGSMSPVMQLNFKGDLLAYGVKGRKATNSSSVHFALGQDFLSKGGIRGKETLETASVALRSRDEHRLNSLDFFVLFDQAKRTSPSGDEDNNKIKNNKTLLAASRQSIIAIASAELGTNEATGNNDGSRVEEYLRYTNLPKGYEWCASFISWCYGKAGLPQPRTPWSPALFPKARTYYKQGKMLGIDRSSRHSAPHDDGKVDGKSANLQIRESAVKADVFGVYGVKAKRINHVGLVKELQGDYLVTIEGNSNNRVESRRRHLRTVHCISDWTE